MALARVYAQGVEVPLVPLEQSNLVGKLRSELLLVLLYVRRNLGVNIPGAAVKIVKYTSDLLRLRIVRLQD